MNMISKKDIMLKILSNSCLGKKNNKQANAY